MQDVFGLEAVGKCTQARFLDEAAHERLVRQAQSQTGHSSPDGRVRPRTGFGLLLATLTGRRLETVRV